MDEQAKALLPGEVKQLVRDADALVKNAQATLDRFNVMIDKGEALLASIEAFFVKKGMR